MADYEVIADIDTFMRAASKAAARAALDLDYVVLDDAADRDATAPEFIGQIARMTRGGSWYVGYGTTAGEWSWLAFGDFTPPVETTWAAGGTYAVGDLVKVPTQILSSGNTLDAVGSDTTATLDTTAENFADGALNGCFLEIVVGTGLNQRRKILDYTSEVATVAPWIGGSVSGSRQLSGFATPIGGDEYRVTWRSGHVIYECISAHTAGTYFAEDLNNATPKWRVYIVEDYHYHMRGRPGASTPHEAWLMDSSRADDWSGIKDEVWKLFPSSNSPGAIEIWGSEVGGRYGTIHFTDGAYYFGEEIKWLPRCTLMGPETPASMASTVVRLLARTCSLVTNGGSTYQCIRTHEAAAASEPGTGGSWTTYWRLVQNWSTGVVYYPGDIVAANGKRYRCHVQHTSADGSDNDPVSPNPGTTGTTWFRWWQEEDATPAAWASGTYYVEGWDLLRDAYFVKGMDFGTSDTAHSVYSAGLRYLFLDANATVRCGVRAHLSQGSQVDHVEVDGYSYCGIRVAYGSDSFNINSVMSTRQQTGDPNYCTWWFDDQCIAFTINNPVCTRSEVGMSFGVTRGMTCFNLETENCGYAFKFRENDHFDFGAVSGTGTSRGEPSGCAFYGMHLARQSTDSFTVSTNKAGFVRYSIGASTLANSLILQGTSRDNAAANAPYDSIGVQLSGGDTTESYPLYPSYGPNRSNANQLGFEWSLQEMIENQRLLTPLYAKVVNSRYVADTNPATLTDNGTTTVDLLPGLYEIEIAAGNTWDGGNVSIRHAAHSSLSKLTDNAGGTESPDGTISEIADIALSTTDTYTDAAVNAAVNAVVDDAANAIEECAAVINSLVETSYIPGMYQYNGASKRDRWYWHPGGQMEVIVAGVATASASINVYFQPRLKGCQVNEAINTASYPS